MNLKTNFRKTFLTPVPQEKEKTHIKGLIVTHSAAPKAFYLVMDVQPLWQSENKWFLVGVIIFLWFIFDSIHNTLQIIRSQIKRKKIHRPFLSAFPLSHCDALVNQTHLETSEKSGSHEGFSVFTIPHLCALAAQCRSSEIRQQSTDWFSFFLIASLPRLYWEENRYGLRFFRCTDTILFVRDQISRERLAASFISKTLTIISNWCCIGVHWDSKESCKDIWKRTTKDRKRRGKKADVFQQLKEKYVTLFKIYCWAICLIGHNAAKLNLQIAVLLICCF